MPIRTNESGSHIFSHEVTKTQHKHKESKQLNEKHESDDNKKKGIPDRGDKEYKQIIRDRKMTLALLLSTNKRLYGSLFYKLSGTYFFKTLTYPLRR